MPTPDDIQKTLDDMQNIVYSTTGRKAKNALTVPSNNGQCTTDQDCMDKFGGDGGPGSDPLPKAPPLNPDDEYAKAADEDAPRVLSLKAKMQLAAKKNSVPVEYLAGIASRESRAGNALNQYGYDDAKQAYGVMQVDGRYHELEGTDAPDSQDHINQAAGILRDNKNTIDKKFPKWSDSERWRAAIAAYNMGPGNVKTKEHMDVGTTGGDYSRDVLIRAQRLKPRLAPKRR